MWPTLFDYQCLQFKCLPVCHYLDVLLCYMTPRVLVTACFPLSPMALALGLIPPFHCFPTISVARLYYSEGFSFFHTLFKAFSLAFQLSV